MKKLFFLFSVSAVLIFQFINNCYSCVLFSVLVHLACSFTARCLEFQWCSCVFLWSPFRTFEHLTPVSRGIELPDSLSKQRLMAITRFGLQMSLKLCLLIKGCFSIQSQSPWNYVWTSRYIRSVPTWKQWSPRPFSWSGVAPTWTTSHQLFRRQFLIYLYMLLLMKHSFS